jgi:hypothetical protein
LAGLIGQFAQILGCLCQITLIKRLGCRARNPLITQCIGQRIQIALASRIYHRLLALLAGLLLPWLILPWLILARLTLCAWLSLPSALFASLIWIRSTSQIAWPIAKNIRLIIYWIKWLFWLFSRRTNQRRQGQRLGSNLWAANSTQQKQANRRQQKRQQRNQITPGCPLALVDRRTHIPNRLRRLPK